MTLSTAAQLKAFHDTGLALGAKAISSDFSFEIEGFEQNWMLCKQAPWPEMSTAGEIEVPGPLGAATWELQQAKTNKQGQVSFMETTAGSIDKMLIALLTRGGKFNGKIYEGTPDKFLRAKRITNCFLQLDDADRDWDNRAQVLMFSGTLFYHYFGEILPGNTNDYR